MEICYGGYYGTICDDRWTPYDAMVACYKLGIPSNLSCESYCLCLHQSLCMYLHSFVRALCVEFVFVSSFQMHSHCSELHMDRAPMDPWFS